MAQRPDTPDGRELAVLVVSYRRADVLERALDGVRTHLPDARVHVWDNASSGSADVRALARTRPEITWTFSGTNVGYTAAMNALAAQVPGADMLLLNPDAELLGPLRRARAALAEPGVAVVSPTVLDPRGREQPWDVAHREQSVVRTLVNAAGYAKALRGRPVSDLYATAPDEVDGYLTGCALMVSRAAWDALGPLDERFFVYGEDAAWQARARAAGWRLRLVDDATPQVRHASAGTTAGDPTASRRSEDLLRSAQVMVLGQHGNAGPGSLFSAGALLLDRVQRSKRRERAQRRAALSERSGGRPGVVVTSNDLGLGGAERQRILLANELVDRGHPVTLVLLQALGPYTAEVDPRVALVLQPWWQPVVEVPGDEAVVVGGVTNTELGFALGWRAQGRAVGQRRYWLPATHDPARLDGPSYSAAQACALRRADGLLVLAEAHHRDLSREQHLNDRVMIAPNGIPPAPPRPYAPAADPAAPVRFGMLTRVVEYKNPLLLAEALGALDARGHPHWTLDVFGDGPDLERLAAATPAAVADRVRWRGRSSGPDEAFTDIDVLCVPSDFEAFPLVMVEAMTRGMPVMASVSGAVPEMLDDGRAGVLVAPTTREAWTDALAAVMADPAGTAALGAAGRERALARYTAEAMVDDYQRAFARLLGRAVPGGPDRPARLLAGGAR